MISDLSGKLSPKGLKFQIEVHTVDYQQPTRKVSGDISLRQRVFVPSPQNLGDVSLPETVHIYTSPGKTIRLFIIALGFAAAGIWLLLVKTSVLDTSPVKLITIRAVGVLSILFFLPAAAVMARRFFYPQIALTLGPDGLSMHQGRKSPRIVPWTAIQRLAETHVFGTRFLLVFVKHPQQWVDAESHQIRKKSLQMNQNQYGTPFSIGATGLRISHEELLQLARHYLARYNPNASL